MAGINKLEHHRHATYKNSQICDSPDPAVYLCKNLRSWYKNSCEKDVSEMLFVVHDLRTTKHTKFFGIRSLVKRCPVAVSHEEGQPSLLPPLNESCVYHNFLIV